MNEVALSAIPLIASFNGSVSLLKFTVVGAITVWPAKQGQTVIGGAAVTRERRWHS